MMKFYQLFIGRKMKYKFSCVLFIFFLLCARIYSQTAEEYFNSGSAKYLRGDYTGAIMDFSKAIQINPNLAQAYYNRGLAKMKLNDLQGAIEDYTKAIQINPNFAGAYVGRGLAKYALGDTNGACMDLKMAAKLGFSLANDLIEIYCK